MTGGGPHVSDAHHDKERRYRALGGLERERSVGQKVCLSLSIGAAVVVASSMTARAHEVGHAVLGHGDTTATFLVVVGLPVVAGLIGGMMAVRYCSRKRSGPADRLSGGVIGLLLVGLGVSSLLSAIVGHVWLSAAGVIVGAATALSVEISETSSRPGCGNHAELTLGTISFHRLLEGVVIGTLYAADAAVGLVGTVVLAGHATLETAAVSGLYAGTQQRISVVGAVGLVQVGYLVGAIAGLGVAVVTPFPAKTFALAVVGGVLIVVGVGKTERSITAGRPAQSG